MKKVISVILALALCISLIPAAFATDTGYEWARNPKTYVYEFNNAAHTTTTAGSNNWLHSANRDISNAVSGTQEWGFVGLQNFHNFYTTDTYLNMSAHVKEGGGTPYFGPGTNAPAGEFKTAFGLELDVDVSGKYTPALTFTTGTSAPIVDIFLLEKPADEDVAADWYSETTATAMQPKNFYTHVETTDSSNRIGIAINMYGETSANKTVVLSPVTLDASKNYFLLIVPCGMDTRAKADAYYSTAYDSATIKLVSFALSEKLTEANAKELKYDITLNALNVDKIPEADFSNNSYTTEVIRTGRGTLDNLNLANWKYKLKNATYKDQDIMNLQKTAPYSVEVANGKTTGEGSSSMSSRELQMTAATTTYTKTNPSERAYVALRLNIPYSGKYSLKLTNDYPATVYPDSHIATEIYFGVAPSAFSTSAINKVPTEYKSIGWFLHKKLYAPESTAQTKVEATNGVMVDVPVAGEYYIVFMTSSESLEWNSTKLNSSSTLQIFNLSSITLTPLPGEVGEEEAAIAAVADTMTAEIAEESSHNLSNSAVVNVLTTTVNSDNDTSIHTVTPYTTTRGAELTVEASEYDDYTFLYWTKGIGADRRVVSDSESYTLTAPAGGTYLTAVYKAKDDAQTSVVFFDASGNELSRTLYDEGEAIVFPSVPSLTDHTFEGWALAGQTGTVESATATGNQMIFVAQFSEEPTGKSVAVKVNGVATNYAYGSLVEVSATERKDGNGSDVFLYWTKDNEIVSFDKNYSFLAAENCGLEAVYGAYKPSITASLRRIIISESFAEFIGLDAAKEKGVLFNKNGGEVSLETATHKIAVKNGGNQLKFENDLTSGTSVIGYAIMDDDTVIYGK